MLHLVNLQNLQCCSHRKPAAPAKGCKTQRLASLPHGIKKRHHDAAAGCPHGVAQTDPGTVHVGDLPFDIHLPFAPYILRREGLI